MTTTNHIEQNKDIKTIMKQEKYIKHLEAVSKHYFKKLETNPDFKNILNERSKANRIKKNNGLLKTKGRPRTKEPKPKRAIGRPRKYNILPPTNNI